MTAEDEPGRHLTVRHLRPGTMEYSGSDGLVHSALREMGAIRTVCRTLVSDLKRSLFCQAVRLFRSEKPPIDAENEKEIAMLFEGGFSFANFLMDVLAVFVFVVLLWLLVTVFGDLFRRQDISGWSKT